SCLVSCQRHASLARSSSSFSFFLIKPSLQSNILMADSIPSTKVCRNCKQEKPAGQFISKTKSSITRRRLTANCLDCRNQQASRAPKRSAEQAELSPIRRERLPLIDLQLHTLINPQESILLGTPIATSTRAGAPITSPPGPSIASQEGPGGDIPATFHATSRFRASGS
ncbi:hypothetical protein EDB81DRAFT_832446, partial [Dactylonectria macrodidyma]